MLPHPAQAVIDASPIRYEQLRERLRHELAERRKWTAMPRLLDEVDACRRLLVRQGASEGARPAR